jgi:hypothetical protein
MKHVVAIVATLVVTLAAVAAQDKPAGQPKDANDQILIANERALYEAVAGGNKAAFLALAASEGVWTTRHGFVPMNLLADGLGGFKLSKWDIVNPRVTRTGEDSAVVLYVWRGAGTFGDEPLAPTTLAATVWTRRSGKWLAIHHQETDLVAN